MKTGLLSAIVATTAVMALQTAHAGVITFDELSLAANSYFRTGTSTTFSSGGATFHYDASWGDCCWAGFTYSNRTDTVTPGYLNDGSAITGDGFGPGQDNYAVGFADGARLEFDTVQSVVGGYFSNTTYAYLAMRDGNDGNSTPFIKGPFGPDDFFTLTVTGHDASDTILGSVDIALATGTSILDSWTYVDLASLGLVKSLTFSFASSDTGMYGINTPTYFAMDNLMTAAVPIPASIWLLLSGLGTVAGMRLRGGSRA